MQLIVETASDIDINNKMSTLEDPVDKNLFNDLHRFQAENITNCIESERVVDDLVSEHIPGKEILEKNEENTENNFEHDLMKENIDNSLDKEQLLDTDNLVKDICLKNSPDNINDSTNGINDTKCEKNLIDLDSDNLLNDNLEKDICVNDSIDVIKDSTHGTDDGEIEVNRIDIDSDSLIQNGTKELVTKWSSNLIKDIDSDKTETLINDDSSETLKEDDIVSKPDKEDDTKPNEINVKDISITSNEIIVCDVEAEINTQDTQLKFNEIITEALQIPEIQQSDAKECEDMVLINTSIDQELVPEISQNTQEDKNENTKVFEKDIATILSTDVNETIVHILDTNTEEDIGNNKTRFIIDNNPNLQQANDIICSELEDDDFKKNSFTNIEEVSSNKNASDNKVDNIEVMEVDLNNKSEVLQEKNKPTTSHTIDIPDEESMDLDDVADIAKTDVPIRPTPFTVEVENKSKSTISRLSLDILSDDEEEESSLKIEQKIECLKEPVKQCVYLEEDDDIMVIEEDSNSKDGKNEIKTDSNYLIQDLEQVKKPDESPVTLGITDMSTKSCEDSTSSKEEKGIKEPESANNNSLSQDAPEKPSELNEHTKEIKPLVPSDFLTTCKKNMAEMTRADLEDFCIMKIVESVVDRSSLSEIKSRLKVMAKSIEDHKRKATMITKQNRDLQVVLKSIQEEQKKKGPGVIPLKITRSVGMQIHMVEPNSRKKIATNTAPLVNSTVNPKFAHTPNTNNKAPRCTPSQNPRLHKQLTSPPQIPVPRLVPAANVTAKSPVLTPQLNTNNNLTKLPSSTNNNPVTNGNKNTPTKPDKRPFNRVQSMTVDLTDDEPPAKVTTRSGTGASVRVVPQQNLLAPGRPLQFSPQTNNPRKVYIPISAPQAQNVRPGQIMLKTVGPQGMRQRIPNQAVRQALQPSPVRMARLPSASHRHPAPLPDAIKQYQPPNWKAIPPAPDLKLSKVENGIVISWKIEDFQEDMFEEIASYQLYAYQETSSPPNTNLWKKIGDVKALPLPMACTLTQFMAGYRYYFAVRAVDVRSRLGTFSLPGSILLLSKTINGTNTTVTKQNP